MMARMERLTTWLKCAVCAALVALACLTHARADDLDEFNRSVEAAMSHRRAAAEYLRTGNIEAATREIDAFREAWAKIGTLPRPAAFHDQERYTSTILQVAAQLLGVSLVLNLGRADVARETLDKIRRMLSDLRRENGVMVLADCVLEANIAMEALFATGRGPDWDSAAAGGDSYAATLRRCDGIAPRAIHDHPEFRRLIDGALGRIAQFSKAVDTRDADLLQRVMMELRSLDDQLALHYG